MDSLNKQPANDIRDEALQENWWTQPQREYMSDIPTRWDNEIEAGGRYMPPSGRIDINPYEMGPGNTQDAIPTMQHELRHAWQFNMLSPRERMEWLDQYNLAVMQGRMQPEPERSYFPGEPNARALESYARHPEDLPYEMYRFYEPPTTPVSQWPTPAWRRPVRPFDPSRAR
ncbi:MAG: hypothetical protein WC648_04905 [Candidatus Paceibacterota bacterium]